MSSILEKSFGHREILLRDEEGNLLSARVELGCKDWTEDNRRRTECRIKLLWSGGEIECIDFIFWESFKRVREQLAKINLYPMCYGASQKVLTSSPCYKHEDS